MSDMWLPEAEDPRMQELAGGQPRGERAVDLGYLSFYRHTLELKCQGLSPEQLAMRAVPPSSLSLLGLLRHMAGVEMSWNKRVLQGNMGLLRLWRDTPDERDRDFDEAVGTQECVDEAWAAWRREVADAQAWLEGDDFDRLVDVDGDTIEVRDVVVHLVEEYARHCGHADLLRECVDGRTGQ
jgi:hypothetical protein